LTTPPDRAKRAPVQPARLLLATRNRHKRGEVQAILGDRVEVFDLDAIDGVPAVEETGATFAENAALKALAGSAHFDGWVLADDSGLEVDALGGQPGVRSARFAGETATDGENNRLLLSKLDGVRGKARSARFRCAMAVARGGALVAEFDGTVEGLLVNSPKGAGGFGYDPLFIPEGFCETFGELDPAIKNTISHRANALSSFREWASHELF